MIKGSAMFEDEILLSFLDASANRALERVKNEQLLTVEEAMPLLLKAQFNHIAHLDQSIAAIEPRFAAIESRFDTMVTRSEFQEKFGEMDKKFGEMDKKFERIDSKFEGIDKKFERMDDRFERMFHRMNAQIAWTVGTILASSGIVFGLNRLFP